MGGAISTYIAERENISTIIQGIVNVGAALLVKDETESAVKEKFTLEKEKKKRDR